MEIKLLELEEKKGDKGTLIAVEGNLSLPFEIKRVYYMYNVPSGMARGFHAHYDLQQLHICVSGSCRILVDDGREQSEVVLDRPNLGLLLDRPLWREIYDFSQDCVLLVLADKYHAEEDYIRDYNIFLQLVNEGMEREGTN